MRRAMTRAMIQDELVHSEKQPDLRGITVVAYDELRSPIVKTAFDLWRSKCRGNDAPNLCDLDPFEAPGLLPHLVLKETTRNPTDARVRIVGANVREHLWSDPTGRWISEIPGMDEGSVAWKALAWVVATAKPLLYRPPYVGPRKQLMRCEAAELPLTNEVGDVIRTLVALDFLALT